jgi:hypothetical protein
MRHRQIDFIAGCRVKYYNDCPFLKRPCKNLLTMPTYSAERATSRSGKAVLLTTKGTKFHERSLRRQQTAKKNALAFARARQPNRLFPRIAESYCCGAAVGITDCTSVRGATYGIFGICLTSPLSASAMSIPACSIRSPVARSSSMCAFS